MKDRFFRMWETLKFSGNPDQEFAFWNMMHNMGHRDYHNAKHIEHCLDEFEEVRVFAKHPDRVEFSLWYHDVFNVTRQVSDNPKEPIQNELSSAEFALGLAQKYGRFGPHGKSEKFQRQVYNHVMATKHDRIPTSLDGKIVVDCDLAILGQPEDIFRQYEKDIRKEWHWLADEDFKKGRSGILEQFLKRDHIYLSKHFHDKYETQARKNLQASIIQISQF